MDHFIAGVLGIISNATFWGIIIGAGFTLTGVHLTNLANDRRLKEQLGHDRDQKNIQLEHDRDLKNRERGMSLRKEIFLDAAEAIHAGLITMSRLAHLEIPPDKLTDDYMSKASSIAKVHVVAQETTIKALLHFSGEFAVTFLRLGAKRLPLLRKANDVAGFNDLVASVEKERSRLAELLGQHTLEGSIDQRKRDYLQTMYDLEKGHFEQTSKMRDALAAELYPQQIAFMQECTEATMRLWRLAVPVVISARNELDLPVDEIQYGKMVDESILKQTGSMGSFGKELQSQIETPPSA